MVWATRSLRSLERDACIIDPAKRQDKDTATKGGPEMDELRQRLAEMTVKLEAVVERL